MTGKSILGQMPPLPVLFERAGVDLPARIQTPRTVMLGDFELLEETPKTKDLPAPIQALLVRIMEVSAVFAAGSEASRKLQVMSFDHFLNGYNRSYARSLDGYISYVSNTAEAYATAIESVNPSPFYDEVREMHTYVTGTTGSGKTELLKALVHHDLTHQNAAVIIDPQGNFARAVAQWPEFAGEGADRLVYINPSIIKGFAPALNPLDASHLANEGREALAKSMTDVLSQVGGRGEWTSQAETIADNCFKVLVHQPGATLRDLRLAMVEVDRRAKDIPAPVAAMQSAGLRHYNREVRDFFEYDFLSGQFATSRNSLRAKIGGLLRDDLFTAITCQPSKIFLEKLIDQRKIIIFDLGAWGDARSAGAFGRMVLAQVSALGTRRSMEYGTPKTPVHVYVDEADLFVSPSMLFILSKLRQQGIHLTLAQQTPAYGYSGHDRDQLLNNTGIKFTAGDGQGAMLKMMNAPPDATRSLKQGQFIGRWGRGDPFKLTVRSDFVTRAMSADEWDRVLQHQIAAYYAPVETQQDMLALPSPSAIADGSASTVKQELSPAEKMLRKPEVSEWPD